MSFPRLLSLLAVSLLAALPARAAVTVIQASGDTFVATGSGANNYTANNYGAAGAVAVASATAAGGKGEQRAVLRFDVSSTIASFDSTYGVGNWSITGVALELTATAPNNAIFNQPTNIGGAIQVQWVPTDNWVEGTGNPGAPSASGLNWTGIGALATGAEGEGTITFAGGNTGTADYALTTGTSFLNDLLTSSQVSFILSAADANVSGVFNSRTFGTASARPGLVLTVAAVPEPGRFLLVLCGVCGIMLRRRRSV